MKEATDPFGENDTSTEIDALDPETIINASCDLPDEETRLRSYETPELKQYLQSLGIE